jgi:hypothetical protein
MDARWLREKMWKEKEWRRVEDVNMYAAIPHVATLILNNDNANSLLRGVTTLDVESNKT